MTLIKDWRAIAMRAHSMWAIYLGILALWAPDLIFLIAGIDTSPRLWFWVANALLVYGAAGRLIWQGIDRTAIRSPAWIVPLALALMAGGAWYTAQRPGPAPVEPVAVAPAPVADAEAAAMAIALPLVARWEGLRTTAYRDPVGIWTVCYGETSGVRPGDSYTEAECAAMLDRRLRQYRNGILGHLTVETIATRLPPPRDAAFTSFAYNVGVAGAGGSTAVRRLNAGNVPGACEALTWWNKAGGRVLRGLVARRAEERDLCLRVA